MDDDQAIPMKRAEVTRDEVIRALDELALDQPIEDITIRMVQDRLGGRGAVSTISVHRRSWLDERAAKAKQLPSTEVVSQVQLRQFQDQLGQVLGGLRDRLDSIEKGSLVEAVKTKAQLEERERFDQRLAEERQTLERRLADERQRHEQQLAAERGKIETLLARPAPQARPWLALALLALVLGGLLGALGVAWWSARQGGGATSAAPSNQPSAVTLPAAAPSAAAGDPHPVPGVPLSAGPPPAGEPAPPTEPK